MPIERTPILFRRLICAVVVSIIPYLLVFAATVVIRRRRRRRFKDMRAYLYAVFPLSSLSWTISISIHARTIPKSTFIHTVERFRWTIGIYVSASAMSTRFAIDVQSFKLFTCLLALKSTISRAQIVVPSADKLISCSKIINK